MLDRQECILPKQQKKKKDVMDLRERLDKEERGPELYTIQSFQIEIRMKVLIWLSRRKREERETLRSLRLGCLSHSHLQKNHVRRQSFTYLPFQSVTRMQYQQKKKTGKKEKGKKERSPQRNGKKTMTSFSISATYSVQRLRRDEEKKEGVKKNPEPKG